VNRVLITLLKFGMSIGILAWLFNKAWRDDQFEMIAQGPKDWRWLGLAIVACFAAHLLGFLRWRVMVRALDLPFSLVDATRIGFIGCFFNLFAFGVIGGDSLRAFYVSRQMKDKTPQAIGSVIADRAIGLLTMFSVAALAFMVFDFSTIDSLNPNKLAAVKFVARIATVVSITGFFGLFTLLLMPKITHTPIYRRLIHIPRIGSLVARLADVFLGYAKRPGAILLAIALSLGINVCFAITIFAIASGIAGAHPSFAEHFLIEPIAMVANAVPLPGGLGGMEFALDFLYQSFSKALEPTENGVVVAFAFRFTLLLVSASGAIAWFANRRQLVDIVAAETVDGAPQLTSD
jgi:uncharacterized protein (TIRG00374 family)